MQADSAAACDLSEPSLASRGVNNGVIADFSSLSASSHWNVSTFALPRLCKGEITLQTLTENRKHLHPLVDAADASPQVPSTPRRPQPPTSPPPPPLPPGH